MTKREHALAAAARGWSVIPLKPQTKIAAVRWDEFKERRATNEEIEAWWAQWPEANIGVICGPVSGIVVGDVDPRHGGSVVEMERDAPSGFVVNTPGLGAHFYYRHPGGSVRKCKPRPGIDFQADGSYVVGVGSHVVTPAYAGVYTQVTEGPLTDPPTWLLKPEVKHAEDHHGSAEAWVASTLTAGCSPGTRNDTLARLAGYFAGRGTPADICAALLIPWVLRQPGTGATQAEAARTIESIYTKEADRRRSNDPSTEVLRRADELVCDVTDLDFPEQLWIVRDFVAPGCMTEIVGKVKKGKSTFVYQMVKAIHTGTPFLNRACERNSVLVMTEQLGGSLKATLARAKLLGGATGVYVMLKPSIRAAGTWANAVAVATEVCARKGIQVMVIDTLSRLAGLAGESENQSGIVGLLDPFLPFRKSGGACIFVRHARKGQTDQPDDIADAARGSSAITGDMDIILNLAAVKGHDVRKLSWQSRISDDPEDTFLQYTEGVYVVTQEPDSVQTLEASTNEKLVWQAIDRKPDASLTELMGETGLTKPTVSKYRKSYKKHKEMAQFSKDMPPGGFNGVTE